MAEPKDIFVIYEEVLSGKRKRFPPDTWNPEKEGLQTVQRLFRYLILEKLQWNRDKFCKELNLQLIIDFRLKGGLSAGYENNIYPFVTDSFPDWKIQPYELLQSRVPKDYWNEDTAKEATRWLIEKVLKWDDEKVANEISRTTFSENNLGGMLKLIFENNAYSAVVNAYPEKDWKYLKERHGYKLTPEQADEIREYYKAKRYNQYQLADMYNVSPANINLIVKQKLRTQKLPYKNYN